MKPPPITKNILVFDPGDNTGIALLTPNNGVETSTLKYPELLAALADAYSFRLAQVVVVERYTRRPGTQYFANEIGPRAVGAIELFCVQNHLPLVFQQPGDAKAFGTDAKLKEAGWKWDSRHERDALKHALLFLWTNKEARAELSGFDANKPGVV